MILNEQKYGTKRIWWNGSKTGELIPTTNFSIIPMVWFTSDPHYTFIFTDKNSFFLKCKLKEPLQVFNGLSTVDLWKLDKKLHGLSDNQITIIKNLDWFSIRNADFFNYKSEKKFIRDDLIKAIYELKFDGISNFESQSEKQKNPSIGLFNENNVLIKNIFSYKEFLEETHQEDFFKLKEIVRNMYYNLYKGKSKSQIKQIALRENMYKGQLLLPQYKEEIELAFNVIYGDEK
jgi:hypothetical protein